MRELLHYNATMKMMIVMTLKLKHGSCLALPCHGHVTICHQGLRQAPLCLQIVWKTKSGFVDVG
jgi:hypothetical protein